MARTRRPKKMPRFAARRADALALVALLAMAGFAIAGPSGIFAWSTNLRLNEVRQARLAVLTQERDRIKNRVELLDPKNADPDLAGELVRSEMGVVSPRRGP